MAEDKKQEVRELAQLTPFSEDAHGAEGDFARGNMFVETSALEVEAPLAPWQEKN